MDKKSVYKEKQRIKTDIKEKLIATGVKKDKGVYVKKQQLVEGESSDSEYEDVESEEVSDTEE